MLTLSLTLLIIGAVLIITEVIIGVDTGLDLLLVGLSLFIGGIIGYYTNDQIGVITATLLSISYIVLGRKYVKNKIHAFTHTSNVDTLLHKVITVKTYNNQTKAGISNVKGEQWRIVSDKSLTENQQVVVTNIDGVSLIVSPTAPVNQINKETEA